MPHTFLVNKLYMRISNPSNEKHSFYLWCGREYNKITKIKYEWVMENDETEIRANFFTVHAF